MEFRVGLCEHCVHMREIKSDRGSTFYRCALYDIDSRFPKYPRLPVLQCPGYQAEKKPAADERG